MAEFEGDSEPTLSLATLAALQEFASFSGITLNSEDDVISTVRDHFDVKDKRQTFPFTFERFGFKTIEFSVKGVKRHLGQTLSSTGLTM